jgi:hypothetical protein
MKHISFSKLVCTIGLAAVLSVMVGTTAEANASHNLASKKNANSPISVASNIVSNSFEGLEELLAYNERSTDLQRQQTARFAKKFIGPNFTGESTQDYLKKLLPIASEKSSNAEYRKAVALLDKNYYSDAKYIRTATEFDYEQLRRQFIVNLVNSLKKSGNYSQNLQTLEQEFSSTYKDYKSKTISKSDAVAKAQILIDKYPDEVAIIKKNIANLKVANTKFVEFRY